MRDFEDNSDWQVVTNSAVQNLAQHTFKQASEDFQNYLDKLKKKPGGHHEEEARQALDLVVGAHFKYLGDIKNYDDFTEEFNKVCEMYPTESVRLETARNWLVFHTHDEIGRLYREVASKNLLPSTALDKVSQLRNSKADLSKRKYLDDLSEALKSYLQNPTIHTANYFLYFWQRPPSDCVKMDRSPTVFYITLESLDVSLADSVYNKLKGWGDADPKIRVSLCKDNISDNYPYIDELFSGLGTVNARSFLKTIQKSVVFERGSEALRFSLDDADLTGDRDIESGILGGTASVSEHSATWNFSDGSVFTLHYTMQ